MAERLNCEESAADWSNHGMDRVPDRIDPGDFVREKFEDIESAREANDPGIAQDFERLVLRGEGDPVKMNGQTGSEDGQIQVDPGERSQAERHSQKIQLFHNAKYMTELGFPNLDRAGLSTL